MVQRDPLDNHTLILLLICALSLYAVFCFNKLPDVITVNHWSAYAFEVSDFSCVIHICFLRKGWYLNVSNAFIPFTLARLRRSKFSSTNLFVTNLLHYCNCNYFSYLYLIPADCLLSFPGHFKRLLPSLHQNINLSSSFYIPGFYIHLYLFPGWGWQPLHFHALSCFSQAVCSISTLLSFGGPVPDSFNWDVLELFEALFWVIFPDVLHNCDNFFDGLKSQVVHRLNDPQKKFQTTHLAL